MGLASDISLSDIATVTNNDSFGNGNAWWILILFLLIGGAWNNGYGANGGGAAQNYVLASDFATLQRQISDSSNMLERRTDNIINGICNLGYNEAQLINGVNQTVTASGYETRNAIQGVSTQLAQCCCDNKSAIADLKYTMAMDTNSLTKSIDTGFCQTNFNNQNNTRDIIDSQNAGTRAILDKLCQQEIEAKNEKIAEQNQIINSLQLAASQSAQNQYLINQLRPCPSPAYVVPNPYAYSCGCGCNC